MDAQPIRIPQINANEDEVEVVGVAVDEGQRVEAGEPLCTLESTKATLEFESPHTGYVRRLSIEEGQRVGVGQLLCVLTETDDEPVELEAGDEPQPGGDADALRATRRARQLIADYDIDAASIDHQGIVTERDVVAHLERDGRDLRSPADRPGDEPAVVDTGEPPSGNRIVIYGAGGHARVIIDLIREARRDLDIVGIVDDGDNPPDKVLGVPVIGDAARFGELRDDGVEMAALGIGAVTHNALRAGLYDRLRQNGFYLPNLIHPDATVERSVQMGRGNQIFAGAVISSNCRLGDNGIINSNAVVSHDSQLGDHVHLTPGALLAGGVTVGDRSVVGMGVTVYLGVEIGDDVVISNGNHVLENVDDDVLIRA